MKIYTEENRVWRLSGGIILLKKPRYVVLLPVIPTLGPLEVGQVLGSNAHRVLATGHVTTMFMFLLKTILDSLSDKISTYFYISAPMASIDEI